MASGSAKLNLTITSGDLDLAWRDRLAESQSLAIAGHHGAAMAALLYALEIYLKHRICLRLNLANPVMKLQSHDLEELLIFTGLFPALMSMPTSIKLRENWDEIVQFSKGSLNDLRYLPASRWSREQWQDLENRINDPSDGVLTWIKTQT